MILKMTQVRIMGPRSHLPECLAALQDLGCVQLEEVPVEIGRAAASGAQPRRVQQVSELLTDIEKLIAEFAAAGAPTRADAAPVCDVSDWLRLCSRLGRRVRALDNEREALAEERQLILKYVPFLRSFASVLSAQPRWPHAAIYHLLLREDQTQEVTRLEKALRALLQDGYELISRSLPDGSLGLLLIVSQEHAGVVARLLADAHVQELLLPEAFIGQADPLQAMRERLHAIRDRTRAIAAELGSLAAEHGAELQAARASLHDWLTLQRATSLTRDTGNAFVLQGWTPARNARELQRTFAHRFDHAVVIEEIARADWRGDNVPVVLTNPRLFRPFEIVVNRMPLPKYGSIDATPFVAVFFPILVGIIIGDVGYGFALAGLALLLRRRSRPGTPLRSVSEIAGVCAFFAVLFGLAFGEFLGDLGRTQLGMKPLLLEREEALLPFLFIALGLGLVHILLGLVIGIINAARDQPRLAIGRGLTGLMLVLIVIALLALVRVLPHSLMTPAAIGLLICFPLLVAVEGVIGAVEFFSTLGNVLSYARVMAIGTASVMMAIAANRMSGAMGSLLVGIVFALLFHVVNFALALFSPTIHGLRLHYVEFFRQFYSPGGSRFEPFTHWKSQETAESGNRRWNSSGLHSVRHSPSASPPWARRGRSRKSGRPAQPA